MERQTKSRRGMAIVYLSITLVIVFGMAMFAVDVGRVTVAKSQLQASADAAARFAAAGMASSSYKLTTARNHAVAVAAESIVDGRAPSLSTSNVEIGIWSTANKTFTVTSDETLANAVRVRVQQTVGGANSPKTFAEAIGLSAKTFTKTSVASTTTNSINVTAPSSGNLWLAGAADNTKITNLQSIPGKDDNSGTTQNPKQRPEMKTLASMGLQSGDAVSFEGLSGQANNGSGAANNGPDGNLSWMTSLGNAYPTATPTNSVNGIANVRAPMAACMAVFLNDNDPALTGAPACLDFSTPASRDYSTLSPQLKQPFFVGDGKTSAGLVQHIVIPPGATRIYLGMMDAWQWNDNVGSFNLKFYRGTTISTVK